MFKNIMQFWQGKDFINEVIDEFKIMLDDAEYLFGITFNKLVHNEDKPGLKDEIYTIDRKINKRQKDIRKRIAEHLAVQPSVDIMACLLLMSVVKDAERLGDFAKNLYEASLLLDNPIDKSKYDALFGKMEEDIIQMYTLTKAAFVESDEEKARSTWQFQRDIKKRCDEILYKVAKSDMTVNEGVCFTLMARYLRRIASHLTNIATSVIVPLSDLDYFSDEMVD